MQKAFELVSFVANILDRIFRAVSFIGLIAMLFLGAMEIFFRFFSTFCIVIRIIYNYIRSSYLELGNIEVKRQKVKGNKW